MPELDPELPDEALPDEIRQAEWEDIGEGEGEDHDEGDE